MSNLKLSKISDVKIEKDRTDGKAARSYYTAEFIDAENPFNAPRIRNFFQQHSADGKTTVWKGGNPELVKQFLGKLIPGAIVSKQVEPYTVEGNATPATKFTTVCLSHESVEQVFKAAGMVIVTDTNDTPIVAETAGNKALVA